MRTLGNVPLIWRKGKKKKLRSLCFDYFRPVGAEKEETRQPPFHSLNMATVHKRTGTVQASLPGADQSGPFTCSLKFSTRGQVKQSWSRWWANHRHLSQPVAKCRRSMTHRRSGACNDQCFGFGAQNPNQIQIKSPKKDLMIDFNFF